MSSAASSDPFDFYAPWSLSKSDTAAKCPLSFKLQYIDKRPKVSGTAAQIGIAAHRVQELLLQGMDPLEALDKGLADSPLLTAQEIEAVKRLLPALIAFCKRIDAFSQKNKIKAVYTEQKLGIRKDFTPCAFEAEDAFFRGVIDYVLVLESNQAIIIDHKSGRLRPMDYYANQLDAYAVLVLAHMPEITAARGALHYMAAEHIDWHVMRNRHAVNTMLRPHLFGLLKARAESLKDFQPKLSKLCGWCDFRATCDAYQASEFYKAPKAVKVPKGKKLDVI